MSGSQPVGPWPVWGRVLLVAGVVAVLVVAAVLAFSGREDGAGAAARVVLSVAVAGLALVGINLVAARMTRRSTERLAASLADLEREPDPVLADAAQRARAHLAVGDVTAACAVIETLPVGAGPGAAAVGRCRRTARSAARMQRRQQRVAR